MAAKPSDPVSVDTEDDIREEVDNPIERLKLLSENDEDLARFLDAIEITSPREREMLREIARTRPLAEPDQFPVAHRNMAEALESLARHGYYGTTGGGSGTGPLRGRDRLGRPTGRPLPRRVAHQERLRPASEPLWTTGDPGDPRHPGAPRASPGADGRRPHGRGARDEGAGSAGVPARRCRDPARRVARADHRDPLGARWVAAAIDRHRGDAHRARGILGHPARRGARVAAHPPRHPGPVERRCGGRSAGAANRRRTRRAPSSSSPSASPSAAGSSSRSSWRSASRPNRATRIDSAPWRNYWNRPLGSKLHHPAERGAPARDARALAADLRR